MRRLIGLRIPGEYHARPPSKGNRAEASCHTIGRGGSRQKPSSIMNEKNKEESDNKVINTRTFLSHSALLGHLVLRQLSHIKDNWELTWAADKQEYESEEESYAESLNRLIEEIGRAPVPSRYHDNEDCLAEYVRSKLNWNIEKIGGRWVGEDYAAILEQGGLHDINEENLISAVAGRIKAAMDRNQIHFDDMEQSHRKMLSDVLAVILYHRTDQMGR